jgi:hypothetical protein
LDLTLRAAARVWSVLADYLPEAFRQPPHWTTGRSWLLRLGYYKLTRPKHQATDWVWIADHTVQAGRLKCLAIFGIRLVDLPPPGEHLALRHLEPIGVAPMVSSNGDTVLAQLERHVSVTGPPCGILSDRGADLWAGVQRFCQRHPGTRAIYDVAHKAACLLKRLLEKEPRWASFSKQLLVTKRQTQQTELAFLAPATQRSKARYMNVGPLLDWAKVVRWALEEHPAEVLRHCRVERLEEKFGWLRDYGPVLAEWEQWRRITEVGVQMIRSDGLTMATPKELQARIRPFAADASGEWLCEQLGEYAEEQTRGLTRHERFPGSSEVIESCFGKQKALSGEQSRGGFSSLILGLGAMVGHLNEEVVQAALESTPGKAVARWCAQQLGVTPQAQRQAVFAALRQAQDNAEELNSMSM